MKKDGQAIMEFLIALVALIILFAAVVQIAIYDSVHTNAMSKARSQAGASSLNPVIGDKQPNYISRWTEGPDKVNYSVDDGMVKGQINDFKQGILSNASPDTLRVKVGRNAISSLQDDPNRLLSDFARGHDTETMDVMPILQYALGAPEEIAITCEVWMVTSGRIY